MNEDKLIDIIHEPSSQEPFVILKKASGIPSAPIREGDLSAFGLASELFPQIKNVSGKKEIEGGLVHRIDNDTCGLLLVATTQEFYDRIMKIQADGGFYKTYTALCERKEDTPEILGGFPLFYADDCWEGNLSDGNRSFKATVKSDFRFFGQGKKQVRPVVFGSNTAALKKSAGRTYVTEISIENTEDVWRARCRINAGFRHQVRCHLAWCGFPVAGDRIYNTDCKEGEPMEFYATGLEWEMGGRKFSFFI